MAERTLVAVPCRFSKGLFSSERAFVLTFGQKVAAFVVGSVLLAGSIKGLWA